ncbi:hypothetical protein [Aeromonas phage ZPAH34]|uniref:hypothetical protein n=1 Tax=Aeromonas phage ZPAH34 TaxID=2924888 RepID=UPI00232996EC|nr:hypothetical protein PQD16_gp062 [Aeromonas phage ZPAH34]UOX39621.1 hypothetical protein [Aeromonas phage ZPAH34]
MSYGWVNEKETMANTLVYNHQRRDFFHIFSIKSIGETFGLREYDTLIPLKDYMDSPVNLIDDLLEGVAVGKRKAKEQAQRAAKNKMGNLDPTKMLEKHIKDNM